MDLLRSIDIFREVCKHMSFSQAAERLNLVPSAVSRQLNELEKYLGVRLLERTTRSISLTDSGRNYLKKMDVISRDVQELISSPAERGLVEGHIRMTAPSVLGPPYLSAVVNTFLSKHTNVSISTTFVNREVNLIEEGFDLAVRVGKLVDSNLVSRSVGEFPVAVVASQDYIKKNNVPKYPRELARHNCLINTQFQAPRRWRFRDQCRSFSVKVDGHYEANDDLTIRSLACAGYGIAYLPKVSIRQYLSSGELVLLLTDYLPDPLPVSIVYPSRHLQSEAKKLLVEYLVLHAETQPIY